MMDIQIKAKKPKPYLRALWPAVAFTAVGVAYWFYQQPPSIPSGLWLAEVKVGPLQSAVRGQGQIRPAQSQWLVAESGGLIAQILLRPGSKLQAGDIVMTLRNPQLEDELLTLQLTLQELKAEQLAQDAQLRTELLTQKQKLNSVNSQLRKALLEQTAHQKLQTYGVVSQITLDRTAIDVDELKQQQQSEQENLQELTQLHQTRRAAFAARVDLSARKLELMQQKISQLVIKAPADGVLQQLSPDLAVGKHLIAGSPLAELSLTGEAQAEIKLPTIQAAAVKVGMTAEVRWFDQNLTAEVSRIDPNASSDMVSIDLRLSRTDIEIPAGSPVQATITTAALPTVLHLPRNDLLKANSEMTLYRQDPAQTDILHQIKVRTGDATADAQIIKSGLAAGDKILLEPLPISGEPATVRMKG